MILRTLFGEITTGTIHRVPFFWSILGVIVVALIAIIGIGALFGLDVDMTGLSLAERQAAVVDSLGLIGLGLVVAVGGAMIFAQVNVMAKRLRDMGLPGWMVLAGVVVVTGLVSALISQNIAGLVNLVVWLALLFTPPGIFLKR